ncbi:hypothetical protein CYMTET_28808 [Cymbomonas tetramitiformis]|uniref:EcsC family protein n=1 Tax=Cymbomonas tetramitiformis TaxID=36881 RepID=A0AAE0FM18_9CHLO|nr:hypothetical protein CYMTET_28808 [Cymbomonas tetramitiformis]
MLESAGSPTVPADPSAVDACTGFTGLTPRTGVGVSAKDLADSYASDTRYETVDEAVEALLRVEAAKSFAAGFVSGVGGLWTLPLAVPASTYANWLIQARVAGAIAHLYGHDLKSKEVRTLVLVCLLGDSAWGVLRSLSVQLMETAVRRSITRIPTTALVQINKTVGMKLVVKCGESGAIKLQRVVPLLGGAVAGAFDASACVVAGRVAGRVFKVRTASGSTASPDRKWHI